MRRRTDNFLKRIVRRDPGLFNCGKRLVEREETDQIKKILFRKKNLLNRFSILFLVPRLLDETIDFAAKGLPVELRPQLVGEGPAR